ncbi:hypothetical protein CMO90_03815 [Candidatus Woesearchaeota archaeon]|jgi:predicted methyltransferase|nr:hypothetical protein [Candidatus Woesearchaeota archaeon]|tara:strand:+ start:1307 stop:1951 length:645 start_codon:yes stop_codon:yes gene_type:complete
MKKILTGDGSFTFLNEEFKEVYHSISGAEEEAVKKYAAPTNIFELAKKGRIRILDICFGMGYNSSAAIDIALNSNPECRIDIIGLEKDKSLLNSLKDLKPKFKNYDIIRNIKNDFYKDSNVDLRILFGDAVETIKKVEGLFDVCFLDPFSPRKLPSLWTQNFFKDISSKLKTGGVLATFSCATHVRINLVRAGFDVKDGPCIGRRAPSTIAVKL